MSLQIIDGGGEGGEGRVLAPGAPASPGPCPNDLAQHLQHPFGHPPPVSADGLADIVAGNADCLHYRFNA